MPLPERWRTIPGADKVVPFNATSAQSAAVGASTYAVLLSCSQNCHIAIGNSLTATTSNWLLKSTDPGLVLGISPGEKVSVVQDTAAGNLYIAELTS